MENILPYGYVGLWLVSFGAATILPIGSEAVFVAMIAAGYDPWICTAAASTGNWLGGMTNYYLGYLGKTEWLEKYFKISRSQVARIQRFAAGKGAALAFFSFLPAVGDLIAFVLGLVRANLLIVNLSMLSGKLLRYLVLAYGTVQGIEWIKSW